MAIMTLKCFLSFIIITKLIAITIDSSGLHLEFIAYLFKTLTWTLEVGPSITEIGTEHNLPKCRFLAMLFKS